MNALELHTLLTQALARGLDPTTEVVINTEGQGEWALLESTVGDPTDGTEDYIWFTMRTNGHWADNRITPCHMHLDPDDCPPHGIVRLPIMLNNADVIALLDNYDMMNEVEQSDFVTRIARANGDELREVLFEH